MALRGLLTLALLWLLQSPAFGAIGSVDSLEGEVRIVTAGVERAAAAGAEINQGDLVRTGDNAWVLLAMTDGGSLTLRPNSQLRFDTYRYDASAAAAQNSMFISLLTGAFRSVTGLIGRVNRAGYQITTPTSTIGIRGTDHEPAYYPAGAPGGQEPGTYDKVNQGESFIRNPRGEVSLRPGQSGFVHFNASTAPRLLPRAPAFYQTHAALDQRAAARRQEFHRRFEQQNQRRLQERKQGEPRRELIEQRKQERQQLREQRREEKQERRLEREKKRDRNKE